MSRQTDRQIRKRKKYGALACLLVAGPVMLAGILPHGMHFAPSVHPKKPYIVRTPNGDVAKFAVTVANPTFSAIRVALAGDCCSMQDLTFATVPPLAVRDLTGNVSWRFARVEEGTLRVAVRVASGESSKDQVRKVQQNGGLDL
jgi:hypothetical protein